MGDIYCRQGNYTEAIKHFEKAKTIITIAFKDVPNHPHITIIENNLQKATNDMQKCHEQTTEVTESPICLIGDTGDEGDI